MNTTFRQFRVAFIRIGSWEVIQRSPSTFLNMLEAMEYAESKLITKDVGAILEWGDSSPYGPRRWHRIYGMARAGRPFPR